MCGPDGKHATFSPNMRVRGTTVGWQLTRVEDALGNNVHYRYDTDSERPYGASYLSAIESNGVTVTLYYEPRPDLEGTPR